MTGLGRIFSAHHGVKFRVVDDSVMVGIGLLDDVPDLFVRHGFSQELEHDSKLTSIDVAIAVLGGIFHIDKIKFRG